VNRRFLGAITISVLLVGCGTAPQRVVRFTDHNSTKDKVTSFSTPSDLRLAFLRDSAGTTVYCAEPTPDVALGSEASGSGSLAATAAITQANSLNATLAKQNEQLQNELARAIDRYEAETSKKYTSSYSSGYSASSQQSGNASLNLAASAKLAVTVAELGGRSQQVLLAREFLYRICEARANNFFTDATAYERLQQNALRLIESIYTTKQSTEAERLAANAELVKQVNEYNKLQQSRCEDKFKACDAVASKPDEKTACATSKKKCIEDIKPLEAPPIAPPTKGGKEGSMLLAPP